MREKDNDADDDDDNNIVHVRLNDDVSVSGKDDCNNDDIDMMTAFRGNQPVLITVANENGYED